MLNRAPKTPGLTPTRQGIGSLKINVTETQFSVSRATSKNKRQSSFLFACLGIYFGLHVLSRSVVSTGLQLDEAEQLLLSQDWRWGYGSQGPLYTWIQKILFSAIGTNVFALSLLKNTLLFGAYAFVYCAAREIFVRKEPAVFASASLLLVPNIVWESQRDQTHLILATACAAITLFIFIRLLKTGKPGCYAAFGALVGLGALSKYNFLFFPVSLILAALSVPKLRRAVLSRKLALSLVAVAVVVAPHVNWLLHNKGLALSQSYKFKMAAADGGVKNYIRGAMRFAKSAGAFLAVPILVYAPLLHRALKTRRAVHIAGEDQLYLGFLLRVLVCGLLLSLAAVLLFRVTEIKDRWMQPLLFAAPIVLVGWVRPQLEGGRGTWLLKLAGAAALGVLIAINGTVLGANLLKRAHNLNIPYSALAAELRKAGFEKGTIFAPKMLLGGNLKIQFKESRVVVSEVPYDLPLPGGAKLIVWNADLPDEKSKELTDFLVFVSRLCGLVPAEMKAQYLEVPSNNGPKQTERLGFVLLER